MEKIKNFYSNNHKIVNISVAAIVVIAVLSGLIYAVTYRPTYDISDDTQFQAVPTDSRELNVEEAPVSRVDTSDSDEEDYNINRDMRGNTIRNEADTDDRMSQVPNLGKRFKVSSVGLDVPLGKVNEVDNIIEPTNYTSAFYVANRGVPYNQTNKGTTYIVMHALDDGGIAPGNFLIDSKSRVPKIRNGSTIDAGGKKFTVERTFRDGKKSVAENADVWDDSEKGRMVIITCFPNSNDNQITIAHRDWNS